MTSEAAQQDLQTVKKVICQILTLDDILPDDDLYQAGLTSVMVLPLLSELESSFQITIPDADFLDARTPLALAEMIHRRRQQLASQTSAE
ncbi:MAG TPA: acyl carrier protein [Candidatus Acidoferrales bacterium]|nr:acyl carrier protein [Candidatus Acidoferrales bacterium]